ncbi:MAG TPA: tetratricopeptide repeat protein [Blastocatellia bacterium]|nr:tetratricopeptide repeat protein [Blastocatellia bacterium]
MDDLLETARELKDQGCLNAALVLLRHVVEQDLDNAQAYLDLGLVFFAQADYPQAVKALRVACDLRPDQGVTYFHLALAYQAVGDEESMRRVRFTLSQVAPDWYAKLDRQRPPPTPGG